MLSSDFDAILELVNQFISCSHHGCVFQLTMVIILRSKGFEVFFRIPYYSFWIVRRTANKNDLDFLFLIDFIQFRWSCRVCVSGVCNMHIE